MWMGTRVVWGLVASALLAPVAAGAASYSASYSARARWQPSGDAGVTGYRVYTRPPGGAFVLALDAGLPAPAIDGTMAAVLRGLDVCTAHGVVVTAYRADGTESAFSNEITLTYAGVAALLDSDGDGLSNASEDKNLNCVVDPGETDPTRADTDGDGVPDGRDACQGTAPGAAVNASGCSCAQVTCDDGNLCNGRETCLAGVCQPGTAPNCNDGNPCTLDACDATLGCTHTAIAGCAACTSAAQCDDANPCTADTCAAGRCAHAPLVDGTSCSDGRFCNGAETCLGGVCRAGTPVACDDGNACTLDACDEVQRRCTHAPVAGCCTSNADCVVSDACHTNARCDAGRCLTDPVVCAQPGPCARASCDPQAGCLTTPLPDGTPCDDGNTCTVNDVCTAGRCGGAPLAALHGEPSDPVRTRLTLRTSGRGLMVTARASFATPGPDAWSGDVSVALYEGTGALLYETTVPRSGFVATAGHRAVYREDRRAEGGGVTVIELRAGAGRGSLSLRATVSPNGEHGAALRAMRAAASTSATLNWRVLAGSGCVTGSGQCKGRAGRCR